MVGVLVGPEQKNLNSSSCCWIFSLTSGPKNSLGILMLSCWPECCGWKHRCLMGVQKMRICGRYCTDILSGQTIATSHDLTRNGGLVRYIPLFQGNLGWWNIIIWPEYYTFQPFNNILPLQTLGKLLFFSGIPPIYWNPGVYLASKVKIGFQGICDLKMRDLCVPTNQF